MDELYIHSVVTDRQREAAAHRRGRPRDRSAPRRRRRTGRPHLPRLAWAR